MLKMSLYETLICPTTQKTKDIARKRLEDSLKLDNQLDKRNKLPCEVKTDMLRWVSVVCQTKQLEKNSLSQHLRRKFTSMLRLRFQQHLVNSGARGFNSKVTLHIFAKTHI